MKLINKIILLLLILLVIIMILSTIISLSIRSMEKQMIILQRETQNTIYQTQGLKGRWNVLTSPKSIEGMIKIYLPKMTKVPLNTNIYSIPLRPGIKINRD